MDASDLLPLLLALSREVGIEVKLVPMRTAQEELPVRSGVGRLHGRLIVLLAGSDSVEDRIDALVQGLRAAGPAALEGHFLPPAVRERLEATGTLDQT